MHLITGKVEMLLLEMAPTGPTLCHLFLKHTSAGLSINENADPDVRLDMDHFFRQMVPEAFRGFRHTMEGPDDMPAHILSSLVGCSLLLPVRDGRFQLGTWQGIYLCEFRANASPRDLVVTVMGGTGRQAE